MEQIIALFEGYREQQLSFDQLYTALLEKAQQDASFRHQAIPTIDQVQKSTPIPITNFIELRSQLEGMLQNLPPSAPNSAQPQDSDYDPEATLITPLPEEETHPNAKSLNEQHSDSTATGSIAPHDPTLIATSTGGNTDSTTNTITDTKAGITEEEQTTPPSSQNLQDADDDEATVIMSADRLGSLRSTTPATAQSNAGNSADEVEEETLMAPATATATGIETADHDAATLVGTGNTIEATPPASATHSAYDAVAADSPVEPPTNPEPTPPKTTPTPKIIMISVGVAAVIVAILIGFLWPSPPSSSDAYTGSTPKESAPKEESWGSAPAILQPPKAPLSEPSDEPYIEPYIEPSIKPEITQADTKAKTLDPTPSEPEAEPSTAEPSITTGESNRLDTSNTTFTDKTAAEDVVVEKVIAEKPVEKIEFASTAEEVDYLFKQITRQEESNNLGPAEKAGTATYFLVKLIKLKPGSPLISKARSRIAKAHLALANTARENENWDAAQQHLDDAFTVRLPDSYQ